MSEPSTPAVQVFLVDDEASVTEALGWLLDSVRISSRGFHSASEFLAALERFEGPACAVLDLHMPEMSGLELQQRLVDAGNPMPLVFLTAHGDVPAAVNAMQAGAIDFVQKPFDLNKFLASVRRAMRLARERHDERAAHRGIQRRLEVLSTRELDVLRGLLDGRTSKEIAKALAISPKTVDVHRANVMRKMDVSTSAQLVRLVGRNGDLPRARGQI